MLSMLLTTAVAAGTADAGLADYQTALRCTAVGTALASAVKVGNQNPETVKSNHETAEKIVRDYLVVLRFEGKKLGKSPDQISNDYKSNAKSFSDAFFSRNFRSEREAVERYNGLVAEANTCGRSI
jgi:ApbE superfamily uncharacterized protein (UPF0280 family)